MPPCTETGVSIEVSTRAAPLAKPQWVGNGINCEEVPLTTRPILQQPHSILIMGECHGNLQSFDNNFGDSNSSGYTPAWTCSVQVQIIRWVAHQHGSVRPTRIRARASGRDNRLAPKLTESAHKSASTKCVHQLKIPGKQRLQTRESNNINKNHQIWKFKNEKRSIPHTYYFKRNTWTWSIYK